MSRKEELIRELKVIEEEEERIKREKEIHAKLKSQGKGVILKRARCKYNLYYCSEYKFKEINNGFYRVGEILGSPEFKKDDILVYVQDEDGDFYWVKEDSSREN